MKAVIEMKTADIDGFMIGMRAMTDQASRRETRHEGPGLRRRPRRPTEVRPTPTDELETMLAWIPFGLHEMDDARWPGPTG